MNLVTVQKGVTVFAGSPDIPEVLDLAKQYIKLNNWTQEEVGIFKLNGIITVVTKQLVELSV